MGFLIKPFKAAFFHPSTFFLFLLGLIPFERTYDRFFRKFLSLNTYLPYSTIHALYVCLSDFFIVSFLLLYGYFHKISWKKFFFQGPVKYLSLWALFLGTSLCMHYPQATLAHWVRFFYFCISIALFACLVEVFRSREVFPFLKAACWVLLALGLFETVVAIVQYGLQKEIGLSFLNETKLSSSYVSRVSFNVPENTGKWLGDWLSGTSIPAASLQRSYGTFSSPNILGGFYIVFLPALYALWMTYPNKKIRFFFSLVFFLEILGLFTSFSRAALLTFVWITVSWFSYFIKQDRWISVRSLFWVVFLSMATCFTLLYPQLFFRGGIISHNDLVSGSNRERLVFQDIAWKVFQKSPWLGVGYGRFAEEAKLEASSEKAEIMVHNIYFLLAVEGGILSLATFLLWIFLVLKRGWKQRENPLAFSFFLAFLGLLLIGHFDFYLLFMQPGRILFFFIAALVSSMGYANRIFLFSNKTPARMLSL